MSNPINDWIRKAKTPKEKDKRRYIVAGCLLIAGVLLAVPTYGVSLILCGIALVKVKNALTDET